MKKITVLSACLMIVYSQYAIATEQEQSSLELKLNGRFFSDEGYAHATTSSPHPTQKQYDQSALGLELNYQSAYYDDVIGIDASVYAATQLSHSGTATVQLFDVLPNGQLQQQFASIGVLALKTKWGEGNELRVGRQKVDTLLLKSTFNRAVPDTFSGASLKWNVDKNLNTYAGIYNRWQPRTADQFGDFVTDNGEHIKYIAVLGAKYKYQNFKLNAEYLNSADYLNKYALILDYAVPLAQSKWAFKSGALFSQDAGHLFKCGAEADLDCRTGDTIHNHGQGYFIESTWNKHNWEFGAALTKIYGFWIEDNYSTHALRTNVLIQDNGTNPFPTSTAIGPDFTNKDEWAWMARVKYDWKDYLPGLSTEFKSIAGRGAQQSNLNNNIEGKERYQEFNVAYKIPWIKNLDLRYAYLIYHSSFERDNLSQKINGLLRSDWHQQRLALTYSYKF